MTGGYTIIYAPERSSEFPFQVTGPSGFIGVAGSRWGAERRMRKDIRHRKGNSAADGGSRQSWTFDSDGVLNDPT